MEGSIAKTPRCYLLLAVVGTSGGTGLSHSPMCLRHPQHSPLYQSGAMIRPSPMAPPHRAWPCHCHHRTSLIFASSGQQDWAGCAPLAWGTRPVPDLRQQLGRHAAAETHAARRAGGIGGPSCPRPASIFSRIALPKEPVGFHSFPHPHVPRKIGSAGACLFAVAGAPVCDYSCSTAGCCGALCASARVPRSASTPVPPPSGMECPTVP